GLMAGGVLPALLFGPRSGRHQGAPGLPARDERPQPFQILRGGRQVKLLRRVPEPSQPDPAQSEPLLEFGKQSLDLVALSLRTRVGWRASEGAHGLARRLLPVHEQSADDPGGTALLLRTPTTLLRRGAVDVAVCGRVRSTIPERLALGTIVRVLLRRIAKLVPGEPLARLMAPINQRDVRLDALPEEPGHDLTAAIGFVGTQTLRAQAQPADPLEHLAGGKRFVPKARRGGRHIDDDAAGI